MSQSAITSGQLALPGVETKLCAKIQVCTLLAVNIGSVIFQNIMYLHVAGPRDLLVTCGHACAKFMLRYGIHSVCFGLFDAGPIALDQNPLHMWLAVTTPS